MGLNTIFSYIFWNELEPSPGVWDWDGIRGMNDIAAWYQAIQDAGLQAVLRPGGYICGERDWGGMPAWLSQIQNCKYMLLKCKIDCAKNRNSDRSIE
jgi:beta-galactosidase GanA